jgi:hypothetical protein
MKKENLLGQKFARLLVIDEAEPVGVRHRPAWLCQCDCGNTKVIKSEELKSGDTKSCGCWNQEKRKERAHGFYSVNTKYSPQEASARAIWRKRYKDEGNLPFEDFFRLSQLPCYYCEVGPITTYNAAMDDKKSSQFAKDNGNFQYNGLDRIDSSQFHSLENIVTCCKWCNFSKRERTSTEFDTWIEQIYRTLQKRKGL